jgi:hypothetical protein
VSISAQPVRPIQDHAQKEDDMKYMLLIHQDLTPEDFQAMPEDERNALAAEWQAIRETPGVSPGEGLQGAETSTTVRVQDGRTLTTDGPFAELKDAIAGYLLYEADDLDAAIELAARIPAASRGGAVEVRPIREW